MSDHLARIDAYLTRRGIPRPPCGFDIGPGWVPHVERALDQLIELGWDKKLDQVKSKFCQLRVYLSEVGDVRLEVPIREACEACAKACENCGEPHGLSVPRSGGAFCPSCIKRCLGER